MRRPWLLLIAAVLLSGCNLDPVPPTLDFGTTYAGATVGPLSAHWVNNGDKPAQVLAVSTKLPYAIANAATFSNPQDIAPGASSQTVQITFSPTTTGDFPEEARPVVMGVRGQFVALTGRAVWAKNEGSFSLVNRPPNIVGSFDFSSYPIQPNQPIDWGIKALGAPATEATFLVKNSGTVDVSGTGLVRLLHGDRHFRITFPSVLDNFNIAAPVNGALGTREIRVEFNPSELGEWMDVIEVTDTANPANRAGITLKAKVVQGE